MSREFFAAFQNFLYISSTISRGSPKDVPAEPWLGSTRCILKRSAVGQDPICTYVSNELSFRVVITDCRVLYSDYTLL